MKNPKYVLSLALTVFLIYGSSLFAMGAAAYKSDEGPYRFSILYTAWIDESRSWDDNGETIPTREIPLKIYVPDPRYQGKFPLILISHGLGGDVDSLTYMADHLASYGYIVVSVGHRRSDYKYLQDHGFLPFLFAAAKSDTRKLRLEDMKFVLDRLIAQDHTIELIKDRIDPLNIGALGHSFGAFTTLSLLGQLFDGEDHSDARVRCGVAYSPQGSGVLGLADDSWDCIYKPVMTMAGTRDTSIGTTDPLTRREPFDRMKAGDRYHVTLYRAEHGDFEDQGGFYHDFISQMTIAFFDAYLLGDADALHWLYNNDMENISSYVSIESK